MSIFKKALDRVKKLAKDVKKFLTSYRKTVEKDVEEKIWQISDFRPELLESLNFALMEYITERFQYLSTAIKLSPEWIRKKKSRQPIPVRRADGYMGPTRIALPRNANKFGQATGYLLEQVLLKSLSHNTDHPGFSRLLNFSSETEYQFTFEVNREHFFLIKKWGKTYVEYIDDRVVKATGRGLLQMRPAEQEKFYDTLVKTFQRLTGIAGAMEEQLRRGVVIGGIG